MGDTRANSSSVMVSPAARRWGKNLGHRHRMPPHHSMGQYTEAGGLVPDLVVIAGLKSPLVGEKQAPGELGTPFPPMDLALHTSPQLEGRDIAQEVDTLERLPQGR